MDATEFIRLLRSEIQTSAIEGCISQLCNPSGRMPSEKQIALSKWFSSLPEEDRAQIREVLDNVSEAVVFGFLCVLDGVRTLEDGTQKGSFELRYTRANVDVLLNDPEKELLHDMYKAV